MTTRGRPRLNPDRVITNNEKQARFRERMKEKGFQQKLVWVRVNDAKTPSTNKWDKHSFKCKLDEITVGLNQTKLSRLYARLLKFAKKDITG